jgi:hypothetical protein
MLRILFAGIAIVGLLVVSMSCANNASLMTPAESRLGENWGRSVESAKYNQTLNPDAGKNLDPVTGLDGQAADAGIQQYRKSFSQQSAGSTGGSVSGAGTGMGIGTK